MLKKKARQLALLGVATLPVVTMLYAARPARADTYEYPLTGSTWYLNQLGSDWYDKDTLSTDNAIPPGNGNSVAIIGDFGSDPGGRSNTNVTYNYSYGSTGIGTLEIDSGNTLTQSANYALVAGSEYLGDVGIGTYSQSAGSNTFSTSLVLGEKSGSQNAGNYSLSGGTLTGTGTATEFVSTGTFTHTGGTNTIGGNLQVGTTTAGSSGSYTLDASGATVSASGEYIGNAGTGTFNQFAGTNTTSSLSIATTGSSATYALYGGTLNGGAVTLGTNGSFTQSGGVFNFTSFSQTAGSSSFTSGFVDTTSGQTATVSGGTFTASDVVVSTGASFTQTGGTLINSAYHQGGGTVSLSSGINLAATSYSLSGGTLSLPSFSRSASSNQLTWTGGGLTLTSQAFDVTSATSDSVYGGYIYGSSLTLGNGMSLNITGGTYPQENIYGSGSSITQQTGSSNTTTNLYLGSTGSSSAQYILHGGSLTVTGGANIGYNLGEGGSGYSGYVFQDGGTAQYGTLSLGVAGSGTYLESGGSATVTNATNLDAGASLQLVSGSFTTGSFFGPGSKLVWTGGTLGLTNQVFDVTTTTDPTYGGFIYGSALTLNSGMTLSLTGSTSELNLFGSGSTITQATGSSVSALYLFMGDTGTGATTVQYNLNGGALTVLGEADVGYALYTGQGAAAFTQSGGTSSFKTLDIGVAAQAQSAGSFTLSAGTMTVSSAINLTNGTFHQSGGTLTFPAFNQSGGTANFDNGLSLASSTYALSGGALTTSSITGPGSHLTWTSGSLTLSNQAFEVTTATSDPTLGGFIYGSALTLNSGMSLTAPSSGTYPEEFVYGNGSSITQNTGSTNSTDELLMGSTGTGTPSAVQYTLNGGTLTAAVTVLGYNTVYAGPAAANFTQTGGTVVSGATDIGQNGVGTYSLSGGTAGLGNLYVGVFTGGSGTLTVSGSGAATASTLTIGNANNAAGVVNLGTDATTGGNGSLTVGSIAGGSSTGGKSFYFNGGTLVASGDTTTFISGLSNAYVSDGGAFINNNGHAITIGQPLLHAGNGAIDGGLTSTGSGTLTLSGSNTFNGGLTIEAGEVQLANAGALNSTTPNSVLFGPSSTGTLALNGNSVTISGLSTFVPFGTPVVENASGVAATLTISNAGANTYEGVIQDGTGGGALSLTKNGAGTLTLAGSSANTFTGTTTVNAGTLVLDKTAAIVAISGPLVIGSSTGAANSVIVRDQAPYQLNTFNTRITVNSSGLLDLNGYSDSPDSITLVGGNVSTGAGTIAPEIVTSLASSQTATISGNFDMEGYEFFIVAAGTTSSGIDLDLQAVVSDGSLEKGDNGLLNLSGNNTFHGGVIIDAGVVRLANAGALNTTTPNAVTFSNSTTGTLRLNGNSVTISGLSTDPTRPGSPVVENASSTAATLTVNSASNWNYAGVIQDGAGGGALSLTKAGSGTLTLSGANTYTGATSVNSGTLTLAAGASLASSSLLANGSGSVANINGSLTGTPGVTAAAAGVVNFGANTGNGILLRTLGSLTIRSNGHVNLLASTSDATRTLLTTSAFTFNGTPTNRSELDLSNNDMVVHGGSLSTIQGLVNAGFNNAAENGVGIISSTAAADSRHLTTLGDRIGGVAFDGIATTSGDVLVKYTYYGDADLNGSVNGADYQQIDTGFGSHFTGWQNGDFNYDGVVDGSDFALIDNTFNQITATGAAPLAIMGNPAGLISGSALTIAVPEPGTLSLIGLATAGLLARRRPPGRR